MTTLSIYPEHQPQQLLWQSQNPQQIQQKLAEKGVRYARWTALSDPQQDLLQGYQQQIASLAAEQGYQSWDVIQITDSHPDKVQLRQKFLTEHTHSDDEVRFFAEGSGWFYLHLDAEVWLLKCQQYDLLSVPANTKHWFDMGAKPYFTAIRIFNRPEGWLAALTGSAIAAQFPQMP